MHKTSTLLLVGLFLSFSTRIYSQKIFDVHIHGGPDISNQISALDSAGVYQAAMSSSWDLQNTYRSKSNIHLLYGLMLPCPNGKVPYSQQPCFANGKDLPELNWVEQKIKEKQIDFIGEVLSQYYGISPSDTMLYPYYALAEKYNLPVGIHTGLAGPNHGSPNFKISLGNPVLFEPLLIKFPQLKVWMMHSGAPYLQETLAVLSVYRNVYTDISAISNPYIFPSAQFYAIMKTLIDAGFEDRLMFGSDNGDIRQAIASVNALDFLSAAQKEKIFYRNAEKLFARY